MTIKLPKISVFIVLALLLATVHQTRAQQDSQYTQYMYNTMSMNPGYSGSRGSLSMLALYRNQWVGLDGAPKTLNFGMHSPIGVQGVGLGLGFTSDKLGPSSESIVTMDFSYTIDFAQDVKLAFGVKGGLSLFDLDPNKLTIYNPNDYDLTKKNYGSPVVGAGFYLYSEKWYMGLSTPNFLETEYYNDIQVSTATEKTHIYLIGGYVFQINPDFKLKPAFLTKAVIGAPLSVDISANALLYETVTFGLAYRWSAAVTGMAGFQVNENIMIGYAYDYETTELSRYNSGSHEIFIRFELGTRLKGKVNPRFF
ncbi:type IX secretion system membrane protein PorP/SprF [Aequorivita sp. H23M31]|uniref:Type IX secretion system membrane protein PorP/SprF n=1 Tax=Aequorivita ciconiae TaxID=2494375 RepID=A0A410G200_9FLAO|nr:type IX secretion system membrane protein PorP/SprF [Aequorivita sp. H23M31]QAA81265.1 type IX secretion system membrane protein PorP/SprF [Aequorivita sp. H23M31]